jgi:hypothetical protein
MGRLQVAMIAFGAACAATGALAFAAPPAGPESAGDSNQAARVQALEQRIVDLEKRTQPELGQQMLMLELRHDRLWWAGQASNWNLAYYMAGELGEDIQDIVETNGDAAELQPRKLSEVMPAMLSAPLKNLMDAIGTHDKARFAKAYDDLSAACTGCHRAAGNPMLIIQRPGTPILDDLRYAPLPDGN